MDVASSSLVRSLFGGVEGPSGVSASNSSSVSNNFLLIGLSDITDRVSLPRRKAPKPTHFSINSRNFVAFCFSFSADFNTITSLSNFSTEAQSFAPISSIFATRTFSAFVRSNNTAFNTVCSFTSSSIFSCFLVKTFTFCFCLSTNFCNGNESCNSASLYASLCPARYAAIPGVPHLLFSFLSSKSNSNPPHSLLTVVVCSTSLSHPFSKKSRAKWNGVDGVGGGLLTRE